MKTRHRHSGPERAFTLVELIVVLALLSVLFVMVLPALARTHTNSAKAQCQNNLKQLAAAWAMYNGDNQGRLVSAYPEFAGFQGSWCKGNASTGGGAGSYVYYGSDPSGITNGLLWPYILSLGAYKCPADKRVADSASVPTQFRGKPILRSVSMNCCMAGTSFGGSTSWTITNPTGPRDPIHPVFVKETEISRPAGIWVILDEDPDSINDGMFLVDVGGPYRLIDLPTRLHGNSYGLNFADGHADSIELIDAKSLSWTPADPRPSGGINDWTRLVSMTTTPLN